MELTFGQVAHALAETYDIADNKRSAFVARLQHFQKRKFPPGTNTGRGRAATYSVGQLFLLGVALELGQLGLTPERAIKVIEDDPHAVAMAASMASAGGPPADAFAFPIFLYCDPAVLSALVEKAEDGDSDFTSSTFHYGGLGVVQENFRDWFTSGVPRMAFFSVSALIHDLAFFVCEGMPNKAPFYEALAQWASPFIHNLEDGSDGDDT